MKVLICGSRNMPWRELDMMQGVVSGLEPKVSVIISGGAKGADSLAKAVAELLNIQFIEFKADWDSFGKAAGPIRNQRMLDESPDLVIAFIPTSGITSGTRDMVQRAIIKGTTVKIYEYEPLSPISK